MLQRSLLIFSTIFFLFTGNVDATNHMLLQPKDSITVNQAPSFPGGESARIEFLTNNIKYPDEARDNDIEGVVVVKFTVSSTGDIKDARVSRGVYELLDKEALRVVELMPKWTPAKNSFGENIDVEYTMPIVFFLQSDDTNTAIPSFPGGKKLWRVLLMKA